MPDEPNDEPFVLRAPAPQRRRGTRRDEARMTRDQMREWAAKTCGPQNDWTPYRTIRTNALREHLSPRDLGRIWDEVCEQAGFDLFRVRSTGAHERVRPGRADHPPALARPRPERRVANRTQLRGSALSVGCGSSLTRRGRRAGGFPAHPTGESMP
jgi:hypothetical protein